MSVCNSKMCPLCFCTCIWASESFREMLWELMVDPDRGLFSCLRTSGPALTECLIRGPWWSTRCWGLCGGLCGSTGALCSPPEATSTTTRPCSFIKRLMWLWGVCCCCFLRLYSIISLLMVLSVVIVYSLLLAFSHHSFLRPGVAPSEAGPIVLSTTPESLLSPPVPNWWGKLLVQLFRRIWTFSDYFTECGTDVDMLTTQRTCTLDWAWAVTASPSDTCTHCPPVVSLGQRAHPQMLGWMSLTGREGERRCDLLPRLLPKAELPLPASSSGHGASGCSCCTDPCTAYRAAWPATPSPRLPVAARSGRGPTLAIGSFCLGLVEGLPEGNKHCNNKRQTRSKTSLESPVLFPQRCLHPLKTLNPDGTSQSFLPLPHTGSSSPENNRRFNAWDCVWRVLGQRVINMLECLSRWMLLE